MIGARWPSRGDSGYRGFKRQLAFALGGGAFFFSPLISSLAWWL
jgi:hypothetical protein